MIKNLFAVLVLAAGVAPAQATVVELGVGGQDTVYMDGSTALSGNQSLSMQIDTSNTSHGALNFSNIDNQGLINCNLSGSTFTANGYTCKYNTSNILVGLSPAPNVFKVQATGTSATVKVSFGMVTSP